MEIALTTNPTPVNIPDDVQIEDPTSTSGNLQRTRMPCTLTHPLAFGGLRPIFKCGPLHTRPAVRCSIST